MFIESVMLSKYLILCHPILLLLSIFPSKRVFSNKSLLPIRWPKYWNFSLSVNPANEYSALISFRIDWFTGKGGVVCMLFFFFLISAKQLRNCASNTIVYVLQRGAKAKDMERRLVLGMSHGVLLGYNYTPFL